MFGERSHGNADHGEGRTYKPTTVKNPCANLPVRPTVHADSGYMAQRPDDTLFDGIFAGGYILNKSNRMPAWGETLSREQIWALVGYLRKLCRCRGPEWAGRGGDEKR